MRVQQNTQNDNYPILWFPIDLIKQLLLSMHSFEAKEMERFSFPTIFFLARGGRTLCGQRRVFLLAPHLFRFGLNAIWFKGLTPILDVRAPYKHWTQIWPFLLFIGNKPNLKCSYFGLILFWFFDIFKTTSVGTYWARTLHQTTVNSSYKSMAWISIKENIAVKCKIQ